MRKILIIICLIFVAIVVFAGTLNAPPKQEYIRIHIRANSNQEIDQNIKYKIKDQVVVFLTPYIANCKDKTDFENVIKTNLENIEKIADKILENNGFSYSSKATFKSEEFPTRCYGDFVLESGLYDALILELGKAKGDNWWCVVYPPLCFVDNNNQDILYKSKILEILNLIIDGN